MKKTRFTESQVISILKEADAGIPVNEIWRQHGASARLPTTSGRHDYCAFGSLKIPRAVVLDRKPENAYVPDNSHFWFEHWHDKIVPTRSCQIPAARQRRFVSAIAGSGRISGSVSTHTNTRRLSIIVDCH